MKYHDQTWHIPEETVRVAQSAFPKGAPFMLMRDEIGVIYKNSKFGHLFSHRGKRAEAPGNLALVMVMQYAEGLTDEQAAQAVRSRIDWKYALGLPLTDPGFDASVLSRFRQRVIDGGEEMQLLDHMLAQFSQRGWVKGNEQRTDSTHVLAAVRQLNRLEVVGESMRAALSALAVVAPAWLKEQVTADWFELYGPRFEAYRLPQKAAERAQLQLQIGEDGYRILAAVYEQAPAEMVLYPIPAVQALRQVWVQQYYLSADGIQWREATNLPPAAKLIESPYDVQARYSRKRETKWVGYKVHLTETCSPDTPHLITHVLTTPATLPDESVTNEIHQALVDKGISPQTHYVDKGYVDADNLAQARQQHIDLFGPALADTTWQGQDPNAFDLSHFAIDWEQKVAICPQGQPSRIWSDSHDVYGNKVIHVRFSQQACRPCQSRHLCTTAQSAGRSLKLRQREQHIALQLARQRQNEDDFQIRHRRRAGVEGLISQGVRSFHLRSCRYIGTAKTHLQHILIAAAMNMTRIVCWLRGDKHARTRITPFSALAFSFT